jgi:large subunit ribosomal protein L27
MGKDHTLFALTNGTVKFEIKGKDKSYVNVIENVEAKEA